MFTPKCLRDEPQALHPACSCGGEILAQMTYYQVFHLDCCTDGTVEVGMEVWPFDEEAEDIQYECEACGAEYDLTEGGALVPMEEPDEPGT